MADPVLECAHLTAWGNAWLAGQVAAAAVAEVLAPGVHLGAAGSALGLREWLDELRDHGVRRLQLLLPAAGDVRGMPPRSPFADEVTDRGHGIALVGAGLGLTLDAARVGNDIEGWVTTLTWQLHPNPGDPGDPPGVAEAAEVLTETVASSTRELARLQLLTRVGRPEEPAGQAVHVPPTAPRRVCALVERAERLAEAVAMVLAAPSGARTSHEEHSRSEAFRRLVDAVRVARLAAWNTAVPELL